MPYGLILGMAILAAFLAAFIKAEEPRAKIFLGGAMGLRVVVFQCAFLRPLSAV